jgi:hypothetical protein
MSSGRRSDEVWRCYGPPLKVVGRKTPQRHCKGCNAAVSCCTVRARSHACSCTSLRRMGLWSVVGSKARMDSHLHVTSKSTQDTINEAVARFVFATNVPFSLVDNVHFRALVDTLRPGAKSCGSRCLGSTLLESVYHKEKSLRAAELKDELVTMGVDGWSTLENLPVLGVLILPNSITS